MQRQKGPPRSNVGLVLTGGGTRAAFQADVLKAVGEILNLDEDSPSPFRSISGISAGAINAAYLAAGAKSYRGAARAIYSLWENLKAEQILETDIASLTRLGLRWIRDLSMG